jgi:hypothetical protein
LEHNWDWSKNYPVIFISFGSGVAQDALELSTTIDERLKDHESKYDLQLSYESQKGRFGELIRKLYEKNNEKVVILIDEYDKPILDCIDDKEKAAKIRDLLKNFYSVIKDADPYLRFVFITGVSKFSKVSLFSGLNNLQDITLNPQYSAICGYTQNEFEIVFAERLPELDLEKVRQWYNGYAWLGEKVYNPFDILLFLSEKIFRPYWFESGTPTFLIKLLHQAHYFLPNLEKMEAGEELIGSFDLEQIHPENLLFQTGYLTIQETRELMDRRLFVLNFPNKEVRMSLNSYLLNYFTNNYLEKERNAIHLAEAMIANDFTKVKAIFHSFFASIPNDWYRKNQLSGYEGYYASIFYAYFAACGFDLRIEDATNHGRIDMTVFYQKRAYILEFKVGEIFAAEKALEQIKERKYWEKYSRNYSEIYLIGTIFDKEERNIVAFEAEKMN